LKYVATGMERSEGDRGSLSGDETADLRRNPCINVMLSRHETSNVFACEGSSYSSKTPSVAGAVVNSAQWPKT
jgi:hypothetical protein